MGVDVRVVHWLRSQGHDAAHLRERAMQRASDAEIFRVALAEERIVLTFDLDFSDLASVTRDDRARVMLVTGFATFPSARRSVEATVRRPRGRAVRRSLHGEDPAAQFGRCQCRNRR